jgi:lysine-N-methylase
LHVLMEEHLERTGSANEFEFARMKLDSNGACPFLSKDRLCDIQKEHGEAYLSVTCSNYPRNTKTIDSIRERSLLLSCPEAARLVLLDRRLVPLKKDARSRGARYDALLAAVANIPLAATPLACFWPVRNFSVMLLLDRSYPLWQRVSLLSMLCKRIQAFMDKQEWNRIPALLTEHVSMIATGSLRTALHTIPAQTSPQLGIVMTLIEEYATSCARQLRFAECIEDFAHGIGHEPGRTATDLAPNYVDAYNRYYSPWAAKNEFMLENYFLNYVFGRLFPFGNPGPEQGLHPYREAQLLCFQYGLIKGLLIGMAGHYRSSFSPDHVVKLIQSFAKAVEHNASLLLRIENFFQTRGLNDTNGIAALLRDGAPEAPAQAPKVPTQVPVSPL